MTLRSELEQRMAEQKARAMVRVANRSLKRQPGRLDRLAGKLVEKAAGGPVSDELPADLRHDL